MKYSLQSKIILITGASSGIGAALALESSRRGAKVVLAARSFGRLEELTNQINQSGGEALAVQTDVSKNDEIQSLIAKTLERWGRLDILVNNAGFGLWASFDQTPLEEIRKNFEVNVFGAVACAQAVIPHFRKQKEGFIVNIESIVALRAMEFSSCYSASKHALHAFSEAMRVELAGEGIRVLSICPGLIETEFHQNRIQIGTKTDTGPRWLYMPVEKCAAQIVRAIECGRSRVIVTRHAQFLALMQRISPRLLDYFFMKSYRRLRSKN